MKEFKRFWSPRRDKLIDEEYHSAEFKHWHDSLNIGLNGKMLPSATFYPVQITSKRFLHELIDLLSEDKTAPGFHGPARMARKWR
jgi:hypothetical protein